MPMEEELSMPVKGRDLVSGLPRTVVVDSAGIRDALSESIQRIVNAVRRALEVTPPELASDILEYGIVLTGGGALIRGMGALLTYETGLPVRMDDDPLDLGGAGHRLHPRQPAALRIRADDVAAGGGILAAIAPSRALPRGRAFRWGAPPVAARHDARNGDRRQRERDDDQDEYLDQRQAERRAGGMPAF